MKCTLIYCKCDDCKDVLDFSKFLSLKNLRPKFLRSKTKNKPKKVKK